MKFLCNKYLEYNVNVFLFYGVESRILLSIEQIITLPDMIFLTDPTMRISYTFHLLELYDTGFPYSITSRLRTRHL
jgi:hypothetical protein